jgi:hypothetical protein
MNNTNNFKLPDLTPKKIKVNKKTNLPIVILFIIVFGLVGVVAYQSYNFYMITSNSEWKCIAEQCVEYLSGDDWVDRYCKVREGKVLCEITYQGQQIELPIENIEVDKIKECSKYKCVSEVLIKNAE